MARIGRNGVITGITPDIMLVLAVTTPLVVVVVVGAVVTTPGGSGSTGGCALLGWYQKW